MRKLSSQLAICLAVLCLCVPALRAQNVAAGVTGNITDVSGAVIPNARVTVHNVDTGVDTVMFTNRAGIYRAQSLPIGRYELTVDAPGFGEQKVPVFTLEALQIPSFNLKLSAGGASETVTVSDAAPILNTSDATLSGTFTANTIQNFPLNGLDFSALTLYLPGSVSTAGTAGTQGIGRSLFFSDSVNVNGNRAQANNYTLDGIDLNETFNNLIAYSPAPEALGEVKVLTANSPADFGNVNGGGIVSTLKSGTNRFHGSVYGYLQDYRLNANAWSNKNTTPITPIQPFSQNQFGATLGGPIFRNKLFFFVDYLGSRYHKGGSGQASVLTAAMRNGDFSVLCTKGFTSAGICTNPTEQLYDTQNGFAPYAFNRNVPITNPVAKYVFAHPEIYPLPNATAGDGLINNNYIGPQRSYAANNQGDAKVEFHPGTRDTVSAFYSMGTAYSGQTAVLAIQFASENQYPSKLGGASWIHIFSPKVVNVARLGFTRVQWISGLPVDTTGEFGTSGNSKLGINYTGQAYQGFTGQNISSATTLGNPAAIAYNTLIDNTYSYIDSVSIQSGRHSITAGVQALRYQNNYPTSNNYGYLGQFIYNGKFTGNPNNGATGYAPADFVLDRVDQAQVTLGSVNVGQRQWRAAAFVADNFKVTPTLTLNFGVRYEYDQPWIESNNKTGNFDLTTGQPIYADHIPTGAPAGSGLCSNRGCYQSNFRQIMPRLGFAYQASDRMVVRGGYGATSFYEGNSSNQRLTSIYPFIQGVNAQAVEPSTTSGGTPRTAEQGFAGGSTALGGSINVYPQNIQPAYVQEYNLTTEYALTRTLSLQVGYLGETGQHIEDYGNANQWRVNGDPTSAPYYNNKYIGINGIDPEFGIGGTGGVLITESRGMMNYNALQVTLRQRSNHGLEYTFNYTYSKAMTNTLGNYALLTNGFSGAFQNYYDSGADYGPAGYDITHNANGTMTYELPFGHDRMFLTHVNPVLDRVVGGWKLSVAGVAYSGLPETPLGDTGNNSQSYGNARPNQYRPLKIRNRSIYHWFGTDPSATPCTGADNGICAFGEPTATTVGQGGTLFGTARNGSLRGPGFLNVDSSIGKDFRTFREQSLGFRFDAFNVFNIVSYGNPDTGVFNSTFGNILDGGGLAYTTNTPIRSVERHLQFSANYRF